MRAGRRRFLVLFDVTIGFSTPNSVPGPAGHNSGRQHLPSHFSAAPFPPEATNGGQLLREGGAGGWGPQQQALGPDDQRRACLSGWDRPSRAPDSQAPRRPPSSRHSTNPEGARCEHLWAGGEWRCGWWAAAHLGPNNAVIAVCRDLGSALRIVTLAESAALSPREPIAKWSKTEFLSSGRRPIRVGRALPSTSWTLHSPMR